MATRGRVIERDGDGKPTLIFGVNYDITERKLGDERQRLLLRELNHRVKNTLATVQALATQTVRHARQPSEFLEAFGARLQALGVAHNLLSDREWRGIGISELVQIEVKPFDSTERPRIDDFRRRSPAYARPGGWAGPDPARACQQCTAIRVAVGGVREGSISPGRPKAKEARGAWC